MYHLGVERQRRRVQVIVTIAILATLALLGRHQILRAAGWALVADDPVQPSDWIVIAVDADGAGVLEAADLVHQGLAHQVAVFDDSPDVVRREFARRGIFNEAKAARETRQLNALGVEHVQQIPYDVVGTEAEGTVLPEWCEAHRARSVIVVSSADHTRRLRRVLHRAMKGRGTTVTVRRARYSEFDPDAWWRERSGARTEIVEFQKLLLDLIRHPLS